MKLNSCLDVHPEVENALNSKLPIVALESTIISHGMPCPANIETALMVEDTVRANKVIPATIAIIKGRLKVGLTNEEIEFLATNDEVRKISRRDLAIAVSQKLSGSTTVASTMIISNLAKIAIFATGGIGGVHRGAMGRDQSCLTVRADGSGGPGGRYAVATGEAARGGPGGPGGVPVGCCDG